MATSTAQKTRTAGKTYPAPNTAAYTVMSRVTTSTFGMKESANFSAVSRAAITATFTTYSAARRIRLLFRGGGGTSGSIPSESSVTADLSSKQGSDIVYER